ncbi:MAG: aspartate aminotransferase family protein [Terriglobia bacterium]
MSNYLKSREILQRNQAFICGGVVSINRDVEPRIVFTKGLGAYLWDAEKNRYIDYHAAFSPHLLGHNDPYVNAAVVRALKDGDSLYGAGTTELEGRLAELLCTHIPAIQSVQFLNTGSEATAQAIRVARAATGRIHIIKMQGGYNGWHNDVSCNLMTPLAILGPRVSPGEYAYKPISAGVPLQHQELVHIVNFNDLDSVQYACERFPIAALITEPILQNIGIIKPKSGYLQGLRDLADRYGFVLIFDEVKTGFRHAIGGYASIAGVLPDLMVLGKAMANGYPISALGGKKEIMNYFVHPDPSKRVLLAGTYNAHPVPTAAAIATIERLLGNNGDVYLRLEELGAMMQEGLEQIIKKLSLTAVVARQSSAFCFYFMDHLPKDWHDLAQNHDFDLDRRLRVELVNRGIYFFPVPVKQCSISFAHIESDIEETLAQVEAALRAVVAPRMQKSIRIPL